MPQTQPVYFYDDGTGGGGGGSPISAVEDSPEFLSALGELESVLDRVIYRLDRRNRLLEDSLLEIRTAREILTESNQMALARVQETGTSVWPSAKR